MAAANRSLATDMLKEVGIFWAVCAAGLFGTIALLSLLSSGSSEVFSLDILLLSFGATFLSGIAVAVVVAYRFRGEN